MVRRKYLLDVFPRNFICKWPGNVLDEGFVPFPKRLIRGMHRLFSGDDGLKQLSIILAVADYHRADQDRGPSMDYLAFQTGLQRTELESHLEILVQRGWLKISGPAVALDLDYAGFVQELQSMTID